MRLLVTIILCIAILIQTVRVQELKERVDALEEYLQISSETGEENLNKIDEIDTGIQGRLERLEEDGK